MDRAVLGPADVSDEQLAQMVAASLGGTSARLLTSNAAVFPYDLEALTTGGRYWVSGIASLDDGEPRPYAFFVKLVQSWARSPLFRFVPDAFREEALAMVPWRSEPEVYRSDLSARLPVGLTIPVAHAVEYLDDESAAVWLEPVAIEDVRWDHARHEHAAYLLGRLAASAAVRPVAECVGRGMHRTVRQYANGRLAHNIVPALQQDEVWAHPLVAGSFDDRLRKDLLVAVDDLPAILDELEEAPVANSHGDACTRNLLVTPGFDGFVLIDFGFWGLGPLGFDLSQLLLGEVQMGNRSAGELPDLEGRCLPAYVRGLHDEGLGVPGSQVQRAHALLMLLFCGLSALPFEHLDSPPTEELHRVARERAAGARFILDLVRETSPL